MNVYEQKVENLFRWSMFALGAVCFMKTGEAIVLNQLLAGPIYAVFGSLCFSVVMFLTCNRCKNAR